jgi:hypothetical protein
MSSFAGPLLRCCSRRFCRWTACAARDTVAGAIGGLFCLKGRSGRRLKFDIVGTGAAGASSTQVDGCVASRPHSDSFSASQGTASAQIKFTHTRERGSSPHLPHFQVNSPRFGGAIFWNAPIFLGLQLTQSNFSSTTRI